ncbi:MAG: DNA repair protein RecO, partial [Candidatus Levybacteria bacterium RIFCSPLOWO2_02_FULL_36_8b]
KVRVIAKGIRKTTSRKKGALELFSYVRFFAAIGRNMDIVTEVEIKNSFNSWREDLTKVATAYHLVEIVNRLTAEKQENREVFEELVEALERLGKLDYSAIHPFVQTFKVHILEELGFIERGLPIPGNLDAYIEHLINGKLRTKKFLELTK